MSLSSAFNEVNPHPPMLVHHVHHHVVYPPQKSLSLMHALLFLNASLLNFLNQPSQTQVPSSPVATPFGGFSPSSIILPQPSISTQNYLHLHLANALNKTQFPRGNVEAKSPVLSVPQGTETLLEQTEPVIEEAIPVEVEVFNPSEVLNPPQEEEPQLDSRIAYEVVSPSPSLRLVHDHHHHHHHAPEPELYTEILEPSESRLILDNPPLGALPRDSPLNNLLDSPKPLPEVPSNSIVFEDDPEMGPIDNVLEDTFRKDEINITIASPVGPIGVQAPHGHEGLPTEAVIAEPEMHTDHHHNMSFDNIEEVNQTTSHYIQWTYVGQYGQIQWGSYYPICNGLEQSPIDIKSRNAIHKVFAPFRFRGYSSLPKVMRLINNGHSVQMEIEMSGPKAPRVSGGGLPGREFAFHQLHFHWGATDNLGSEHLVNGKAFPMEIHLVHYNTKYPDIKEALNHPDGLAVLGLFYEKSVAMTPSYFTLARHLANVTTEDSHIEIPARYRFPLKALLPIKTWKFYRYHGSLTTPPCNEAVTWTVFSDWIPVTDDLLLALRHIMIDNYRGPQAPGTRTVFVS